MPPLSETKRNLLLVRHTTDNKRDLVATLAKGRERVEARIVKAARAKNFATSRRIRDGIYRDISQEYKRLQGDLDKWSTRSINNTMRPWFDLAQADLAATAADKAAASFAKFSSAHVEEYFERIHPFNAERLAAVNVHLNPQLTRMLDTDVRALRSAVVDTFRESLIEGGTAADRYQMLSKRVMDYADNPKSWQFIGKQYTDRWGHTRVPKWKKGNYFDMLNRTVSANVARDSYHDALADEGHDLVELIGGLSSNSHDACVQWVGTVFSMTGATKGYPHLSTYEAAGGFHPNCVHITVMATEAVKGQAKGIAEDAPQPSPQTRQAKVPPSPEKDLKRLADADRARMKGTKIVDEKGNPKVVYHGTDADFKKFSMSKAGTSTDEGYLGKGIYFSTDSNIARGNAYKMDVRLNVQNPKRVAMKTLGDDKRKIIRDSVGLPAEADVDTLTKALKAKGYDGVTLDYSALQYNHQEIVVFSEKQIEVVARGAVSG